MPDLLLPLGPPPMKAGSGGASAGPARIVVCQGATCCSQQGGEILRDLEELTTGVAVCETTQCLYRCGSGPNASVHAGGTAQAVSGLRSYDAVEKVAVSYAGARLGKLQRKVARLKYLARREASAEAACALLEEGLGLLGADAEDTEPKLLAEILMLRSQKRLAAEALLALEDAKQAARLVPDRAQAHLTLAAALKACGRGPEAAEQLAAVPGQVTEQGEGYARWHVERREALNHNCILLTLASAEPSLTAAHQNVGDVWHVDVAADLGPGGAEAVVRAYTPASSAKEYSEGRLQLAVKVYPDGRMTQHLAHVEPGSVLRVSAPHQTLESTAYSGVVVVAGGSAVTVALQICEAVLSSGGLARLLLCNKTAQDVILPERFAELQRTHAGFRLVHCLSEGALRTDSPGRFTAQVLAEMEPHLPIVVSGPPGLCRAARDAAKGLGRAADDVVVLDEVAEGLSAEAPLEDKAGALAAPGEGTAAAKAEGTAVAATLHVPGGNASLAETGQEEGSSHCKCCAVM